jgi:hypothetical protein
MPYIFTLVLVFATLFSFSSLTAPNAVASNRVRPTPTPDPAAFVLTRLRAGQPVIAQEVGRGARQVRHANVEVTNVGGAVASNIQVALEQPGGVAYPLRGPKKLQPRERAVYVLSSRGVAGSGSWNVVMRCSNCRR